MGVGGGVGSGTIYKKIGPDSPEIEDSWAEL